MPGADRPRGPWLEMAMVLTPLFIWFAVTHDQGILAWFIASAAMCIGIAQLGEWSRRR